MRKPIIAKLLANGRYQYDHTRFIQAWNSSATPKDAAQRIGVDSPRARSMACWMRSTGVKLKRFDNGRAPNKRGKTMGKPTEKTAKFFAAQGLYQPDVAAKMIGVESHHVVSSVGRLEKEGQEAMVQVAQWRFVNVQLVKEELARFRTAREAKHEQRVKKYDSPTRPALDADFWQTLRSVIREEITAAMSHYEIVVQREGHVDLTGPNGHV